MLRYEENPNGISGYYFETALQTAKFDDSTKEIMSEEEFRKYIFDPNNPMAKSYELSEVTYYSSASLTALYNHLENKDLMDKKANYTSNFIKMK